VYQSIIKITIINKR